ncbi:MAG: acyl-CoA thioesterase [Bacteroidales bacterium]|nr:acyl-CoA thioesterase [Bacteroidales bacterium]MBQ3676197.1 acyl-CoA thioesterase [Bacteroidales bacterium]MBR4690422.1 acyl-CoA thioesterase [Bacteroidales bacterium]MBR7036080.1 acyl-CoA thioesterase [Bacteroidales bacterium]
MPTLSMTIEHNVPFHNLDPMGVVWHGNYVAFMEEVREAFLEKYGLGYMTMRDKGFVEPVTNLTIDYKSSFTYGDTMVLQIIYKPTIKARLEFDYKFFRKSDGQLMTEASTTQHFVRIENKELQFSRPDFYIEWQEKWNVFTND